MNPEKTACSRCSAHSFPSVLLFFCSLALVGASVGCGGEVPPAPEPEIPSLDGERINSYYTNEEIRYFLDVAIGKSAAQGDSGDAPYTLKWLDDIRISLRGKPVAEDSAMVRRVVAELNRYVYGIEIRLVDRNPNVTMHFVPESDFYPPESGVRREEHYQVWVYYTAGMINEATILIPSDSTTPQYVRDPMILSNTAAMLGFMESSLDYPESVFYSWWNWANRLAPIDEKIIEILYLPEILPGMTREQALLALANR